LESGTTVISLGSEYDATRAAALKAAIVEIDGVTDVEFNYTTNKIAVRFDPDRTNLKELTHLVVREKKRHPRSAFERDVSLGRLAEG